MASFTDRETVVVPRNRPPGPQDTPTRGITAEDLQGFSRVPLQAPVSTSSTAPQPQLIQPSDLEGFAHSAPTTMQNVKAFGQTALGSLVPSVTTTAGMFGGAAIGTPLGLPGIIAGGAIGGLGGWLAGHVGEQTLNDLGISASVEDLPPELKPAGFAGEVAGSGIGMIAPGVGLASAGLRIGKAGNFINKILSSAAAQPLATVGVESSRIASAALAEGLTEYYAADHPLMRTGAGIAAGAWNPTRYLVSGARFAKNRVMTVASSTLGTGQMRDVYQKMTKVMEITGEDPKELARQLDAAGFPSVPRSVAQTIDSPAMQALDARLRKLDARFGEDSARIGSNAIDTFREMIGRTAALGDSESLKLAAQLSTDRIRASLAGLLAHAERESVNAASKVADVGPMTMSALGTKIYENVDNAMTFARSVERALWSKVKQDIPVGVDALRDTFATVAKDRLPSQLFPGTMEGFAERAKSALEARSGLSDETRAFIAGMTEIFGEAPALANAASKTITSGELLKVRSKALTLARSAAGAGKYNDARVYGEIAESVLDDLTKVSDEALGPLSEARRFSHAFNDVFTRSFAGTALRKASTGALRIPPEVLGRETLRGSVELNAAKFKDLRRAVEFPLATPTMVRDEVGLSETAATNAMKEMLDAQEGILRNAAANTIDATTGRVNPRQLQTWITKNAELLQEFPELTRMLRGATTAENTFKSMEKTVAGDIVEIERSAASKVLGVDDVPRAVGSVMESKTAIRDFRNLVSAAGRNSDAQEGLVGSVFKYAMQKALPENATEVEGNFSMAKFKNIVDAAPGVRSVNWLNVMKAHGLMTADRVAAVRKFIDTGVKVEKALDNSTSAAVVPEIEGVMGQILTFASKLPGYHVGGVIGKEMKVGPGQLGLSAAAAQISQALTRKLPLQKNQEVLIALMKDTKAMADVLRKTPTPASKRMALQSLHGYLLATGMLGAEEAAGIIQPQRVPQKPSVTVESVSRMR